MIGIYIFGYCDCKDIFFIFHKFETKVVLHLSFLCVYFYEFVRSINIQTIFVFIIYNERYLYN